MHPRVVVEGIQRLRLQEQCFRELAGLCEEQIVKELSSSTSNSLDATDAPALQTIEVEKKEADFDPEEMF